MRFTTTALDCRKYGGVCNETVTVLDGATNPLQCERVWPDIPELPPATRAEPCKAAGCGPAYVQFNNYNFLPQHPDAPKDFEV